MPPILTFSFWVGQAVRAIVLNGNSAADLKKGEQFEKPEHEPDGAEIRL